MSKPPRKTPGNYPVGWCKPPIEHQFPAGRSGNPRGRAKGEKNLRTILAKEAAAKVKVNVGGKTRSIGKLEATVMQLHAKALSGDLRAIERVVALNIQAFGLGAETTAAPLTADDADVLAAVKAKYGRDDDV